MTRARFADTAKTRSGLPVLIIPNPEITLKEAGTNTPLSATIYAGPTGGTTLTNPFFGDSDGNFEFYLDTPQDVKIEATGVGVGTLTDDWVPVPPAVADMVFQGMTAQLGLAGGLVVSDDGDTLFSATDAGGVVVASGKKFGVGDQTVPANTLAGFYYSGAHQFQTTFDFQYINSSVTVPSDVSTVRIYGRQAAGDANNRALEVHFLAMAGSNTYQKSALECSMQSSYVGDNFNSTAVALFKNLGTSWGIGTPQRLAAGIVVGGDTEGFEKGIVYLGNTADGYVEWFSVSKVGTVTGGHHFPRTSATYNLGGNASRWSIAYINFLLSGDGSAAGPSQTFAGDTTTGGYRQAAPFVGHGIATAGVRRLMVSEFGAQLEAALHLKEVASITPITGYGTFWVNGSGVPRFTNDAFVEYEVFTAATVQPRAKVFHNANQLIADITVTALAFNSETYDTDVIHDTVTNNGRLTCKTAGVYVITAVAEFAPNATGTRWLGIRLNGTTVIRWSIGPAGGADGAAPLVSVQYALAVNDYVEAVVWQSSGGALNVTAVGNRSPFFEMVRVSA